MAHHTITQLEAVNTPSQKFMVGKNIAELVGATLSEGFLIVYELTVRDGRIFQSHVSYSQLVSAMLIYNIRC